MSQPMPELPAIDVQQRLTELLNCPAEALPAWIDAHHSALNLPFLQTLKDSYAATSYILAEPRMAERATRYALIIAEQMTHERLALPLARWARGLWAMFHTPEEAIQLFRQAQPAYRNAGDRLSVARLDANLVGVLAECGRFAEAEAAYQAARPEFLRYVTTHPVYLVRLDQNYGWLLYNQGRYADALAVFDQALDLAQSNNFTTSITGIQVNRHLTLGMLGRLAEVEAGFLRERAAAQMQQQWVTLARIDMNLGDLYSVQGRPADALRQFQLAHQTFTHLDNPMEIGSVMLRQASLLRRIGAQRAAIRCYSYALEVFTQTQMTPQLGETLVNYAIARRQEGEYRRATALLVQAEVVWRTLDHPLWLAQIGFERIALALARADYTRARTLLQTPPLDGNDGLTAEFQLLWADTLRLAHTCAADFAQAEQLYTAVCQYAALQSVRWLHRRGLIGWGKLLMSIEPLRAIELFESAASLDEEIRQTLSVEELKASFYEQANDLFDDLIRLAIVQQQPWQALCYAWRAKAGALLDLLHRVQFETEITAAEQTALDQTRQQLATARWAWALQQNSAPLASGLEATNSEITKLEQQLLDLRQQRNRTQPSAKIIATATDAAAVLAQMDADVLFEYVRCDEDLFGIYADRSGHCVALHLADVVTLADLSARLQLRFGNVVARPATERQKYGDIWLQESLPLLAACYQHLVAPLLAHVPNINRDQSILIAPCDPLFLLPFAAFWDGSHFWGERHQLEMMPSGALLVTAPPAVVAPSPPIVIAAASGAMTAVRHEAASVANALGQCIAFVDTPALRYLSDLPVAPRILHIAAHSLLRADAPLFTALQLTGEVLSVEQCYELSLHGTELVTLSGCTTASGQESDSTLLAFQSALFIAGAQRVLCSLWPVSDEATAVWMTHFYRFLAQGYAVPHAVQQVQRLLLADPAYNHPAIWAAFASARR